MAFQTHMECFIKKIWQGNGKEAHSYFVRFGKGSFESRAVLNLQKSTKIKLRGSFEWTNDFVEFVSEIAEVKFSGIILSRQELSGLNLSKKKTGIFQYDTQDMQSRQIKEIKNKTYAMLLDAETPGLSLKIKKKLPKPGKSGEGKTDDKFCQLEADLKYWNQISEAFMLPDCRKCKISHTYVIEDIVMPEGEKDPEKIRLLAKRKGKIIRKTEADKQESQEEKNFEA